MVYDVRILWLARSRYPIPDTGSDVGDIEPDVILNTAWQNWDLNCPPFG